MIISQELFVKTQGDASIHVGIICLHTNSRKWKRTTIEQNTDYNLNQSMGRWYSCRIICLHTNSRKWKRETIEQDTDYNLDLF